ncbi:MAG: restriction endonuclease subunit S [Christensenellaceae bacterium]
MREMKDSGIAWVGEIPKEWEVKPLYCFYSERKNKNIFGQENNLLSLSYGKVIRKDINTSEGLLPGNYNGYNIVEADDIIIRPTDLQNDKRSLRTGLVKERGIITSAYIALKPKGGINSKFYHYILHAYDISKVFYNMGNGVRQGLNYDEFVKLMIFVPSLEEQQKIAEFLDGECEKIDGLTHDIQAEIETLEQYKRSVITEAVTHGLDKSAPMKDSGIAWVGAIPDHWIVIPLKYIAIGNKESLTESTPFDYEFDYIDIGSVTYGKGIEQYQHYRFKDAPSRARRVVKKDDVIISTVRTYLKATAQIPKHEEQIIVSTGFLTLTPKTDIINPCFLGFAVQLHSFVCAVEADSCGVSYPAINATDLMRKKIILPSLSEQEAIAEYLDKKCAEIDRTIADKKAQIETFDEYKKSLIYEYVTGKKEVV